jgi:hypothetical protein
MIACRHRVQEDVDFRLGGNVGPDEIVQRDLGFQANSHQVVVGRHIERLVIGRETDPVRPFQFLGQ